MATDEIAATLATRIHAMNPVHRFTDTAYAQLTLDFRAGHDPSVLFDWLHVRGLVRLHSDVETARQTIASELVDGVAIKTATNDETEYSTRSFE